MHSHRSLLNLVVEDEGIYIINIYCLLLKWTTFFWKKFLAGNTSWPTGSHPVQTSSRRRTRSGSGLLGDGSRPELTRDDHITWLSGVEHLCSQLESMQCLPLSASVQVGRSNCRKHFAMTGPWVLANDLRSLDSQPMTKPKAHAVEVQITKNVSRQQEERSCWALA